MDEGSGFPSKAIVDGEMRALHRRRFCLNCSPFGAHNTAKIAPGSLSADRVRNTRARRLKSWSPYGRKRRRQSKRDLVTALGGASIDCGYTRAIAALEFHHRDAATKVFSIAKFNGSTKRLLAEAAKCDLNLCELPSRATRDRRRIRRPNSGRRPSETEATRYRDARWALRRVRWRVPPKRPRVSSS